ncbi:putative uncharacterized protein [Pseudarthrobacter siccitolerans]|uniref:Uncharacterized protein n=1 Tax=Pseudarthrobacter siccitolerans TaxID=861266 RepID=A0A024H0Y8_9MICC|nr:hypothetical protein [Pseudarthrobacter siccitolerans]CCQ45396.1 putative uncharacterized protein [Pseudarthrobacter siccitolerans]
MDLSLESAKSSVMSAEQEIVALLPPDAVLSTFAHDTSSLMSCDGDRKKWVGDAVADLMPGVDRDAFLDKVAAEIGNRSGWKVSEDKTLDGDRSLGLLHEDGTHLMVAFQEAPESLRIAGYSGCFNFPEYEYGEEY